MLTLSVSNVLHSDTILYQFSDIMSTATRPPCIRAAVEPLLRRSGKICTFAYRPHDAPLAGRASAGGECPARSGLFKSSVL